MPDHRPRRSALYMPGSNPRALEKARALPADVLILDLEDAVAPAEKEAARGRVAAAVKARGFGPREVVVRINGLDTPWGAADLAAIAEAGPDAVLAPKVEGADLIAEVDARLTYHDAPAETRIWAMIETPRGVLRAEEIAKGPGLGCFVVGTNDLVAELRGEHEPARAPVLHALSHVVLVARAYGVAALDGVHNAIHDQAGLDAACRQARALGFDGKTLIHPAQLAAANAAFAPSPEALERARAELAAFEAAEASGAGVAVLDGRLLETMHVESARRLLAEAEVIARLEAPG
jgi:citrate lyase beta subunit